MECLFNSSRLYKHGKLLILSDNKKHTLITFTIENDLLSLEINEKNSLRAGICKPLNTQNTTIGLTNE
jgi:hypothetical protein